METNTNLAALMGSVWKNNLLGSKPVDRINYPINLALGSVKPHTEKNHEFEMEK